MTAIDAIAPTMADLHRHIASASVKSVKSVVKPVEAPDLRKYIILKYAGGEQAVVFPSCFSHRDATPFVGHLVSAGYFGIANGHVLLTGVGSSTLNLKERPQDAALIQSLFSESA